jgi:hypothetical protein
VNGGVVPTGHIPHGTSSPGPEGAIQWTKSNQGYLDVGDVNEDSFHSNLNHHQAWIVRAITF